MSRPEPVALVAGLISLALGMFLWLQDAGSIDLSIGWWAPIACAAVGAILAASGLASRSR
jgi:hypothetical protein